MSVQAISGCMMLRRIRTGIGTVGVNEDVDVYVCFCTCACAGTIPTSILMQVQKHFLPIVCVSTYVVECFGVMHFCRTTLQECIALRTSLQEGIALFQLI